MFYFFSFFFFFFHLQECFCDQIRQVRAEPVCVNTAVPLIVQEQHERTDTAPGDNAQIQPSNKTAINKKRKDTQESTPIYM